MSTEIPTDRSAARKTLFDAHNGTRDVASDLHDAIRPSDRDEFRTGIETIRHFTLGGDDCPFLPLVDTLTDALIADANTPTADAAGVTIQTTPKKRLLEAFIATATAELPGWFGTRPTNLVHPTRPDGKIVDAISTDDLYLALSVSLRHLPDELVATADTIRTILAYGLQILADLADKRRRSN